MTNQIQLNKKILRQIKDVSISIDSEAKVVYLMTRLGIILEILKGGKKRYSVINFYRNLLVHAELTYGLEGDVKKLFKNFIHKNEPREELLFHNKLSEEINALFDEVGLPKLEEKSLVQIKDYLSRVISDIPIKFTLSDPHKYEFRFADSGSDAPYYLRVVASVSLWS